MLALTLAVVVSARPRAAAQTYPDVAPVPRTTSPALLRQLAERREVVERMRAGVVAEERDDWVLASAEFRRALALGPREPQASTSWYDLAIAEANLGQLDDAAQSLQQAIARDPGFLAARANLVAVLLRRGDLAAARVAADAFVAVAPVSARALYSRGLVALRQEDGARALADFQLLLVRNPASAIAYYELGLADEESGRYADAERDLRQAVTLAPHYERAQLALGVLLLRRGEREEARASFDDVVRDGADPELRNLALSLRAAIAP